MTVSESLQVLLIEDSEDDALLAIRALKSSHLRLDWQRVQTVESFCALLKNQTWDVIIADYHVPGFDAPAALEMVQKSDLDIPFIVISGAIGEAAAVEMMKAGAHDYFMKGNLTRLAEAIRREVRDAKVRQEHRDAEVVLKQQQAAIEAVLDGIAIVKAGTYLYLNHAYLELFGYEDATELVGKSWHSLYIAEDVKRLKNEIFPLLAQEQSWRGEAIAIRKDGSTFAQEISLTLMEDGTIVSVCRDITQRKQTEQQLKQLNADLLFSNQELGQFAYVASHDLQEPLRKIRSFAELLSERYQDQLDDVADRYISYITNGAIRLQGLIDDLLSYSRVSQAELNVQETNLEVLLQQVTSDLETLIEARGAIISMDPLPTVLANPIQIQQLFQNLLSNAIKYCQAEVPKIHIGITQAHGTWTIAIKDNGIGIDPQFSERIFVIFQRLHNRNTYTGTGIGLAICKKIIERHGGQIWVDSQEGQGSTFFFSLPSSCDI